MQTPETPDAVEQVLCELAQMLPSFADKTGTPTTQALAHVLYLEQISQERMLIDPETADVFAWAADLLNQQ